jgi:hypothetical protein
MSKLKTPQDGANEERSKILRKIRTIRKLCIMTPLYTEEALDILEDYIEARVKRYKKKLKGL